MEIRFFIRGLFAGSHAKYKLFIIKQFVAIMGRESLELNYESESNNYAGFTVVLVKFFTSNWYISTHHTIKHGKAFNE